MPPRHVCRRPTRATAWALMSLAIFHLFASAPSEAAVVDVGVRTDKPRYEVGEPLHILVTARNPAPGPVTLQFFTSLQAQFSVDGGNWYPQNHLPALNPLTIPGHGRVTWDLQYPWRERPLEPGVHSVRGRVLGQAEAGPVFFEVVPEPATPVALLVTAGAALRRRRA